VVIFHILKAGPPALLKVEELALVEATETEELENLHDFSRHRLVLGAIVGNPPLLSRTNNGPTENEPECLVFTAVAFFDMGSGVPIPQNSP